MQNGGKGRELIEKLPEHYQNGMQRIQELELFSYQLQQRKQKDNRQQQFTEFKEERMFFVLFLIFHHIFDTFQCISNILLLSLSFLMAFLQYYVKQQFSIANMEGGVFGLTTSQKSFLYLTQLVPTLITVIFPSLIKILFFTQIFYILVIYIYVRHLSLQKSYYPYYASERANLKSQFKKGKQLALSAFLLITIYGVIIIKIGKITLPHLINLGQQSHHFYWVCILLSLINPLTEELYWRLFLQKSLEKHYEKEHLTNVCYLIFHFTLFSSFLGFWRAQPFVLTFYSIGRSMKHIKNKYGIVASIMTHYGITFAGFALIGYLKIFTQVQI